MMFKTFTLAAVVFLTPLSRKATGDDFSVKNKPVAVDYFFHYKNTATTKNFEPEKKTTQAWDQNWTATAQENIRKSEYHFTWQQKLKAYCTPNRKNNFRFLYNDKGFTVEPRTTQMPIGEFDPLTTPDKIKYRSIPNWKIKFNLDKKQVGRGFWNITENKAEYITNKITVQYINNDDGMRQNFIVRQPLSKKDELKINFSISTKLKPRLQQNQIQFFHKKNNVLDYKDLKVWDAAGKILSASFQKNKSKYYIKVNAKDAVYPITIDPISTTPAAMVESNQVNANMGYAVSTAGDVNGDGYSDVIAGAHNFDNGEGDEGAAFVYHGSVTGINTTAAAFVESNQVNARMGLSVATAGDVNGDGYSDIIVGAGLYSNGQTNEGAAFIYHGSATGINTTAAIRLESNQANAQMGLSNSVACAGDVNGDGYSDVIVGVWLYDNGQTNEGVAFVYHGSPTGITGAIATTLEANQSAANFGLAVAGAGDVNGDGYSDVIVGAEDYDNGNTDEGAVFIYHGSASGINSVAITMAESNQDLCQYGYAVASAGDVNGDGYSDVIVGAYLYQDGQASEGAAFIYHGSAAGISNIAISSLQSNLALAQLGVSVSCAGDINGDGYSDVIVGGNGYNNGQTGEGAAFVYFGSASGINVTPTILESNQANAQMGRGVCAAGDVNGDGYSDVIVGAYQYDNVESNEGAAFVYHGSATGLNLTPATSLYSNKDFASMGYSVASAGDVNGDGYSDVVVGAPSFDNGQASEGVAFIYYGSPSGISAVAAAILEKNQANAYMGWSVASAGDVNADGYSDVIVGAIYYDNGQSDEGAAFVYLGSSTGINIAITPAILQDDLIGSSLGYSVASAGDVNGDGYGDVIVGIRSFYGPLTNEGAAFVYHGTATGINTVRAAFVKGNQPNAFMGNAVAGAGDVNGDGYSDVIVGVYQYDNTLTNEGAAFVYYGSTTGINTAAPVKLLSNQAGASMGCSVSAAGDVNGDGFSDVIIGAYLYDNTQNAEGAAFIFLGAASGINTVPATVLYSNQADAWMGHAVASAGDVNGDGYSDVIASAPQYNNGQTGEGAAFFYNGSATGINNTVSDLVESNQADANLGVSVASAGDVNGDGYSDAVIGALYYDNLYQDEGAGFIYLGNKVNISKRNNLRMYNTDLTTPSNSSNFLFGNFGAGLYAKSFLGRAKGKLVWETRLNYNAYSGIPITNSTFFTAQQSIYTDMGLTGIELKNVIAKINGGRYTKLRARIKYDNLTAITGQVYSPWRNVSSIIDANNLGILPIDFLSFNAAWLQKGKTARLDFKTDKENGVCCFDIEKSTDGFNFLSIGTLPAKNISGIQSYSFIDANATDKDQFYRIKIKGVAGQINYSNMQHLQNDKATEILVFPNPTTDVLQLQLNKAYDKMNVQILNSSGQLVQQMSFPASSQTITIPVKNLAAGKYWLRLQSGSEKQVLQFVKQ